jgi:hypothetical protein
MVDDSWAIFITDGCGCSRRRFCGSSAAQGVLRRGEGGDARVTSIAYGAGLLFVAFLALFIAPGVAGATADEFDDRVVTAELADSLWVLGNMFFFLAEIFVAVLACTRQSSRCERPRSGTAGSACCGRCSSCRSAGSACRYPIWIPLTTALVWMAESKSGATSAASAA